MDIDFSNIWCWLLPLLCTLLGALFGYLLGKGSGSDTTIDNSAELDQWRDKNAKLQADLDACGKKLNAANAEVKTANAAADAAKSAADSASSQMASTANSLTGTASGAGAAAASTASSFAAGAGDTASSMDSGPSISFNGDAATAAMGKKIKLNDLKVVEGIGPKISEMFINDGISTWKALSETSVADCQKVLNKGGDRYKVHNPASWPLQAKMCYEGKWAELSKWQDEHDHGKL